MPLSVVVPASICYDYTITRSVELIMCSGINSGDCTLRIFFSSIKRDGD